MLINEKRDKYTKSWTDTETGETRITCTAAPLHHESVIGSGNFDVDNDFNLSRRNGARLNGWLMSGAGYHVALQAFPEIGQQPPQGTLAYGGRQGQHWLGLRPESIGYLHWPTRNYRNISGLPNFNTANLTRTINQATFGESVLNRGFTGTWSSLWSTPSGGQVDWIFKGNSLVLKQDFIINQAARDWVNTNRPALTPETETWFGIRFALEWRDIPRALKDGIRQNIVNGDFDGDLIELQDDLANQLGFILPGSIYVRNRGGRATVRKRLYREGGQWYLFLGARVDEVNNLLPGNLIIDPPIAEENITQNSDDAHERSGGTVSLTGFGNQLYMGDYSGGSYQNLQGGFRFQSIPIAQGASITSAAITLYRTLMTGSPELRVHVQDADNAGTFTTTNSDLSGRAVTTGVLWNTGTTPNLGTGNNQDITSTDIATDVESVVGRVGWATNNAMVILVRDVNTAGNDFLRVEDFNDAGTNEARLNITTAAATGAQPIISSLHRNQFKHLLVR